MMGTRTPTYFRCVYELQSSTYEGSRIEVDHRAYSELIVPLKMKLRLPCH